MILNERVSEVNKPFWVKLTVVGCPVPAATTSTSSTTTTTAAGTTTTPAPTTTTVQPKRYYYSWVEQVFTGSGFIDLPGGRFGTLTHNPAEDPNGNAVETPSFVRLQRAYYDPAVDWVYLIVTH